MNTLVLLLAPSVCPNWGTVHLFVFPRGALLTQIQGRQTWTRNSLLAQGREVCGGRIMFDSNQGRLKIKLNCMANILGLG